VTAENKDGLLKSINVPYPRDWIQRELDERCARLAEEKKLEEAEQKKVIQLPLDKNKITNGKRKRVEARNTLN
jgi:hypothetical protein